MALQHQLHNVITSYSIHYTKLYDLEVNDGQTTILCSKIVLNSKEKVDIKPVTKGKEVTQKEYNEIVMKKMKEMQEMFRNNRNGGHGGGFGPR